MTQHDYPVKMVNAIIDYGTSVLWQDRTNFRTFPDGKVLTCMIPYIKNVWYYWQKKCSDGQFSLSVTFITIKFLKDY